MAENTTPLENKPEHNAPATTLGNKPSKEEQITVSKKMLEGLLARIEGLERGEVAILDEVEQKKKATMRVWNKKLVIGWDRPRELKKDETGYDEYENNLVFNLSLKNKDNIEKEQVKYTEFLNEAEKITVEILKMNQENEVQYHGFTTVKSVEGYATRDTGIKVPMKVVIPKHTAIVKLPSGHELSVDVNYLNA